MTSLEFFFDDDFKKNQEDWEKSLLSELKLTEIGSKATKETLHGFRWPTLSLERKSEVQLSPVNSWKKASTTYASLSESEIDELLNEDLKNGVKNFFFHEEALNDKKWIKIEEIIRNYPANDEIEVFLLGQTHYKSEVVKVIHGIITGKEAHDEGGNSVQELGYIAKKIIQSNSETLYLGVFVDSNFFQNIAKLRATRLLAGKILEVSGRTSKVVVIALTSFQGWSLFERYSNILRNETSVASGQIGGADHIQSSGYNALLELECEGAHDKAHRERSQRIARNTTHILALESMLGVVEDASFGSYHLENLTQMFCEESWKFMQRLVAGEDVSTEILNIKSKKLQMIKTRKTIMSGINDFPDVKESLHLKLKQSKIFRPARAFEELRLRMEKIKKPDVYISLFGDYAALNTRLNFVKNYFELLGLRVFDPGRSEKDLSNFINITAQRNEEIVLLCASDDDYKLISETEINIKTSHRYIAGKFEMSSFKNLFVGQNVYDVLLDIVNEFERIKS